MKFSYDNILIFLLLTIFSSGSCSHFQQITLKLISGREKQFNISINSLRQNDEEEIYHIVLHYIRICSDILHYNILHNIILKCSFIIRMMESKYVKLKYHEHHIIKIKMATERCTNSSLFLYFFIYYY